MWRVFVQMSISKQFFFVTVINQKKKPPGLFWEATDHAKQFKTSSVCDKMLQLGLPFYVVATFRHNTVQCTEAWYVIMVLGLLMVSYFVHDAFG